jgi:hypothetical protein
VVIFVSAGEHFLKPESSLLIALRYRRFADAATLAKALAVVLIPIIRTVDFRLVTGQVGQGADIPQGGMRTFTKFILKKTRNEFLRY